MSLGGAPSPTRGGPQPRETPDRCALRAQLRGDPMLGTAFPAARVLLVEQPGAWGPAGLRESRFDPAVAAEVERAAGAAGIRVLAIRQPGRTPPSHRRRWAFADCRIGREAIRWGHYDRDAELLEDPVWMRSPAADTSGAATVDAAAVFLVCAHSRHDACCALRGRPVAAALQQEAPGRVFECSHLGGERFAANVLVAPLGMQYGRVLPFAAREFVEAADRGEVIAPLLRGRVGLTPAVQAALGAVHSQLAVRAAADVTVLAVGEAGTPAATVVRVGTPLGAVDVTVRAERAPAHHLTCHAGRASAYVVQRPVSVTRA